MLFRSASSAESILVFVGGVHQNPATAFSINQYGNGVSYLTFSGNVPGVGTSIVVYHGFDSTNAG